MVSGGAAVGAELQLARFEGVDAGIDVVFDQAQVDLGGRQFCVAERATRLLEGSGRGLVSR
jgi:imidazoleglycerol phosphate dehydratase HisB